MKRFKEKSKYVYLGLILWMTFDISIIIYLTQSKTFWYIKVYIFWSSVNYLLKDIKYSPEKILMAKKHAPTYHSLIFNLQFLYEQKHKVHNPRTACGIFHFPFCFISIKSLHFWSTKEMYSLTLKRRNSFQNKNNRQAGQISDF